MHTVRQKRKSCEACRARKLKCSGHDTGCSRCLHLGLPCIFHNKGLPGRPRKWSLTDTGSLTEAGEPQRHLPRIADQQDTPSSAPDTHLSHRHALLQQDAEALSSHSSPSTVPAESTVTSGPTDLFSSVLQESYGELQDEISFSYDEFGPLPLLDFNTSAQLDNLPLDSFRVCLSPAVHNGEPAELSPNALVTSIEPSKCCDCSKQVFETIRTLERTPTSHNTVHILRQGMGLFEDVLTCPICYDTSNPPRVTLQNVILLGRLSLEVTSGYHRYLEWVKEYCKGLEERETSDTVYLMPSVDISSTLGFKIRSDKLYQLITDGLNEDVQRLMDLGNQFAMRQHNRHLIGHEACPDWEGRCWKEKQDVDPDPSDVCPQSPAARALIPCYRIVEEVRAKIKKFEEAIT